MTGPPEMLIVGGPNGAGKSTLAPLFLSSKFVLVNADEIEKSLKPPDGDDESKQQMKAGRIAVGMIDELESRRASYAVETTCVDRWYVYDTSDHSRPRLVAKGNLGAADEIRDPLRWNLICRSVPDA